MTLLNTKLGDRHRRTGAQYAPRCTEIAKILRQIAERSQVIITTQVPNFRCLCVRVIASVGILKPSRTRHRGPTLRRSSQDRAANCWIEDFGIGSAIFESELLQDLMRRNKHVKRKLGCEITMITKWSNVWQKSCYRFTTWKSVHPNSRPKGILEVRKGMIFERHPKDWRFSITFSKMTVLFCRRPRSSDTNPSTKQESDSLIHHIEQIVDDDRFAGRVFLAQGVHELKAWLSVVCKSLGIDSKAWQEEWDSVIAQFHDAFADTPEEEVRRDLEEALAEVRRERA